MIGAIEILIILVIFGIIYGKDAIDKTYRKRPDEGVVESLAVDVKEFYKENPRRLLYILLGVLGGLSFLVTIMYYLITETDLGRMIGMT
ncbi:MAG: hypothetical protein G3M70_01475 [Candidatus Nitronauta litoralis]|uniref:Uncharacterized protein n=1 Tax=Candidatus Nitronauta litoralis TaxID=2705533 RepID=A0A7T0BTD8_9BACT|nr:MAG: hypothetical protein G3M70_01475 [Candidatus Nitronauta litoralis]